MFFIKEVTVGVVFLKKYVTFLNTDIIENLYGLVRAVGLLNTNPDNEQFNGALKALILTEMLSAKIKGSNSTTEGGSRSYFTAKTFQMVPYESLEVAEEQDAFLWESEVAH